MTDIFLFALREISYRYIYTYQRRFLVILIIDDYFLAPLLLYCNIVVIVILSVYRFRKKQL
jgi:hypothetical protein